MTKDIESTAVVLLLLFLLWWKRPKEIVTSQVITGKGTYYTDETGNEYYIDEHGTEYIKDNSGQYIML